MGAMKVIRIALADADFVALRDLAHRDRRDPRSQARVIVERAVARRRAEALHGSDQPATVS